MGENKLELYPPKTDYFRKLEAFFEGDNDVKLRYDEEKATVYIYVTGTAKAEALSKLLVSEVTFGNQKLSVIVIPSNEEQSTLSLLQDAFTGNSNVSGIYTTDGPILNGGCFTVFKKAVVQYDNDNIGDYYQVRSTLHEDIAREIFNDIPGIFYSTSIF